MNKIEFDEFAEKIFSIDKNIRFVGMIQNEKMHYLMKSGVKSYMDKEITEKSLNDAVKRWQYRIELQPYIGDPFYAMAMFEKIKRFTFPINNGVLCISTEIEVENDKIVASMLDEIKK
ncbi:hypothetical protein [Nitrosarchaeum sp.]|uniref:hypothetical protein n=1 Tax=Nitrosarchaeum sp. TaxID=2026886 RepID=UPI0026308E1F|nr:hypothetical protein [Nitrosarchaeum sp.]